MSLVRGSPGLPVAVSRRRWLLTVGLLVLVAAGATGGYAWYGRRAPEPPAVERDEVEPAVRAALEEARTAVRREPRSAAAWGRLGLLFLAHGFSPESQVCLARAEQLDPSEPRWPYYLGMLLAGEDANAAIAKWQRATELARDRTDTPRLRLADALLEQGREDEAAEEFQQLLQRWPSHPLAHLGLARLTLAHGALRESLHHLQQAAASPATRKAAHTLMASAYERLGDRATANREIQAAKALPADRPWPNAYARELAELQVNKRSRLKWAGQLVEQHQTAEGIAVLQELVRDYPDYDAAWRALGFVLYQSGQSAAAVRALQTALRLAPDSAEAQYYMGCVVLDGGRSREATGYFRRATELKPDYALAHYNLGQCLKRTGDRTGAVEAFRATLRCRPYLAPAHRDLGELLAAAGQQEEAREHLRLAVELDPTDQEARQRLQELPPGRAEKRQPTEAP